MRESACVAAGLPGHPRIPIRMIRAPGRSDFRAGAYPTSADMDQTPVVMLAEPHSCKTWMAGSADKFTQSARGRLLCPGNDKGKNVNAATRFPLCAVSERLPASRSRLFGDAELRSGATIRRPFPARASRTSIPPAAGANSRPRLIKTSLGSAFPGKDRCAASRSILLNIVRRSKSSMALGLVYPAFESRAEIARLIAEREKEAPWPRDPDGAPLYPGYGARAAARGAGAAAAIGRALRAAARYGRGLRARRPIELDRTVARAPKAKSGRSPPIPRPGATSSLRARRRRPVITSRWWSTTRCKVSPRWCGARTCSGRPASIGCCSSFSGFRKPSIGITVSFATPPGKSCRNRRRPRACAN